MAMALIGKVGDSSRQPGRRLQGSALPVAGSGASTTFRVISAALHGTIEHCGTGEGEARLHRAGKFCLAHSFDPTSDLKRNTHGVLELAGNKPKLSHDIDDYFRPRDENFELAGLIMAYEVRVYVVQKADREGNLGDLVAVKLTFAAAHEIAKRKAPANIHVVTADKTAD